MCNLHLIIHQLFYLFSNFWFRNLQTLKWSFESNRSCEIVAGWVLFKFDSVDSFNISDKQAIPKEFLNITFSAKRALKRGYLRQSLLLAESRNWINKVIFHHNRGVGVDRFVQRAFLCLHKLMIFHIKWNQLTHFPSKSQIEESVPASVRPPTTMKPWGTWTVAARSMNTSEGKVPNSSQDPVNDRFSM